MKIKSFTLVELIIVIVVIWILLVSLLRMWWNYIFLMQYRIEKEDFLSTYYSIVSKWMSSIYDNNLVRCDNLHLQLNDNSNNIKVYSYSWGCNLSYQKNLNRAFFSGFMYNGTKYMSWNFQIESYKFGCTFKTDSNTFTTWDVHFELVSNKMWRRFCFDVNLNSCKMKDYLCK